VEEWHWRENRRLSCRDDWKPNPPWEIMTNPLFTSGAYYADRENQYLWDWWDEKNGIRDPPGGSFERLRQRTLDSGASRD
jgi:hypothetical protein